MSDQKSLSDHSWILFTLNLAVEVFYPFKEPTRIDWIKFDQVIKNRLSGAPNANTGVADELGSKIGALEKVFKNRLQILLTPKIEQKDYAIVVK